MFKPLVRASLLVALLPPAAAAWAAADDAQREPGLYQLDKQLQRQGCDAPGRSPVPPVIELDGSGRYVDMIATQSKPAYWRESLPAVQILNKPAKEKGETVSDLDTLTLRAEGEPGTEPGAAPQKPFELTVKPDVPVTVTRSELEPFRKGGIVQLEVLRDKQVISTLWLVLRDPEFIMLNENGAIDSAYRSTIVPAFVPCTFTLEYASSTSKAPSLVITAPYMQPAATFPPITLGARGTAKIEWSQLKTLKREGRKDVQLVVLRNGRAIDVLWLTEEPPRGYKPPRPGQPPAPPPPPPDKVEVLLDRLGVASPTFLNRRRPARVGGTSLAFTSIAPDRSFVVTFAGIPESERAELVRSGVRISGCRNDKCIAAVRVPPGGSISVPVSSLRNAYAKGGLGSTVNFDVAFYDDDNTPTNSRGFLTFVDEAYFAEPASSTTWTGALSVSVQNDPDLSGYIADGHKVAAITTNNPLGRTNRTHVAGSATIGLKQNMGTRADFEAELTAKNGDFGQDVSPVQSSKYLASIYTDYGATITGGRFDLAAPTNAIAFSESGEAVNFGARLGPTPMFGSVGYIFKKTLPSGSFNAVELEKAMKTGATSLDRSNQDIVLQLRDIAAGHGRVRAALYGVIGNADRGRLQIAPSEPPSSTLVEFGANYWTTGGEALVTVGNALASLGIYHSERSSEAPVALKLLDDDLRGDAALLSLSYTNIARDRIEGNQLATDFSVTAQVGHGGRYVGESQAFTPDQLFLSRLAGALVDTDAPIGAGLANKWYYGLVATTPRLDWLSLGKGVASVKLHHYRRTEPRAGSQDLGTEASLEVRVEQPKGVRYQLTLAGFRPGGALNPDDPTLKLITRFQYLVKFNVTVRIE